MGFWVLQKTLFGHSNVEIMHENKKICIKVGVKNNPGCGPVKLLFSKRINNLSKHSDNNVLAFR
jgi:predicted secreted Zn-dependent protease